MITGPTSLSIGALVCALSGFWNLALRASPPAQVATEHLGIADAVVELRELRSAVEASLDSRPLKASHCPACIPCPEPLEAPPPSRFLWVSTDFVWGFLTGLFTVALARVAYDGYRICRYLHRVAIRQHHGRPQHIAGTPLRLL